MALLICKSGAKKGKLFWQKSVNSEHLFYIAKKLFVRVEGHILRRASRDHLLLLPRKLVY